jgi:hypothetical protein
MNHIKRIKKAIESIKLPMVDLPIDTIKEIFDVMVVVNAESYIFVINTSGKKMYVIALKKVAEIKSLLDGRCKTATIKHNKIKWVIMAI